MSAAFDFLEKLRPNGPWLLTAISPDSPGISTVTTQTAAAVDKFVNAHNGKRNLYYSVNPTRGPMTKKAKKEDIAKIEFMLSDLDPTEGEESQQAKDRYLAQLNGTFEPEPTAIIDSGNGIQCLWRLQQPIMLGKPEDEVAIADVEARITAIMVRLGSKAGTQNIDRVLRLPGTTNLPNAVKLKQGRVPCQTKLLKFNGASYPLTAFPLPESNKPGSPDDGGHHARQPVDVDTLQISGRMKDLIRGIDPENKYASRSEAVMAVLIAMVAGGCTDDEMASLIFDKSLPIGAHVREQPKPVDYLRRQIKHAREKAKPGVKVEVKIKATLGDVLKSAADLQHKRFEELRWIVPHYLPEGCSLLAGRPKVGKSWLGLDIAIAVAEGGKCLGQQCEQGDVLALLLEDNDRRLQRRITTMLGAQKEKWPARLTYATGWPLLNSGGLDWIREWIDKANKPRLVIVDILERVRPHTKGDDKRSQYSADYEALVSLQELSAEAKLSILVLTHQRKQAADDLVDTVSGTLGIGGAVDTILILGKDQLSKFLYGRGRDLEEFDISFKQNERARWNVLGPRLEQVSPEKAAIIAALAKRGKPMTVEEITKAVNGKRNNVKELLSKMYLEGKVERPATGVYQLPNLQGDMPF